VGGGVGPQAHPAERQHQELADVVFVVDDEGAAGFGHERGTSTGWVTNFGTFTQSVTRVKGRGGQPSMAGPPRRVIRTQAPPPGRETYSSRASLARHSSWAM